MENDPEQVRNKLIAWWSSIVGVCLIIALGSIFITRAYLARRGYEIENWRPPHLARLETDLNATNRTGEKVSLGELRGKVYVVGYQYTECPAGCLGMASVMKALHGEFGEDPQFRLVSISVNPEGDTPEKMDAWVRERGVDVEGWWFLTGDAKEFSDYMLKTFRFYATEEITDPALVLAQGPYAHDQRLVIVDGDANIRGYYDVMSVDRGEWEFDRLVRDLKMVLNPELRLSDFEEEVTTP